MDQLRRTASQYAGERLQRSARRRSQQPVGNAGDPLFDRQFCDHWRIGKLRL